MTLRQLKFLINLEPQRQKKILARMLVEKLKLIDLALNFQDNEEKLQSVVSEIERLNISNFSYSTIDTDGVSRFSLLNEDFLELSNLEDKLDLFIWEAKRAKRLVKELASLTLNEMIAYMTDKLKRKNS